MYFPFNLINILMLFFFINIAQSSFQFIYEKFMACQVVIQSLTEMLHLIFRWYIFSSLFICRSCFCPVLPRFYEKLHIHDTDEFILECLVVELFTTYVDDLTTSTYYLLNHLGFWNWWLSYCSYFFGCEWVYKSIKWTLIAFIGYSLSLRMKHLSQ